MLTEYNEKIKRKIVFIYGEKSEKKIKERKNMVIVMPVAAAVTVGALLFCGMKPISSLIIGLVVAFSIFGANEYSIIDKARKKTRRIRFDLSEITERLAILMEAGVPLWNAFVILSENADENNPLEAELKRTVSGFLSDTGYYYEPEKQFETLAERCDDAAVSTFVSLIIQNSRKGSGELVPMLRLQAVNQRTERRAIAKQMADEASTLMLLPSVMVLAAVLVLIAAPAVLSFFK